MGRGGAGSSDADEEVDEEEERKAQEEHRTWKRNAPLLYDLVLTHELDWPSLTVQWLPDREAPAGADYTVQRLLLGTHAGAAEQNYVIIAEAKLPLDGAEVDAHQFDDVPGFGTGVGSVRAVHLIAHEGEVNRARYMPQEPAVIATKTISGEVHVFDVRQRAGGAAAPAGGASPELRLQGHAEQGFGLAWAPLQAGHLLSGSNDARICLWDVAGAAGGAAGRSLSPSATFTGHEGAVGDVAWHAAEAATFASVGDDGTLRLWDSRAPGGCTGSVRAHASEAFCLALHPSQPHLVATGGADGAVALFDARRLAERLHTLEAGAAEDADGGADAPPGEVLTLSWAPRYGSVLASSGGERRVLLWDLARVGAEQSPDEAEEGPPELLFAHGGHTAKVSDVAWSAQNDWTLASVAEDRQLQIWAPAEDIYSDD